MKFGFYSPYLDTFGGGERYMLTLASYLSQNHLVDIFWDEANIKPPLSRFLKIDLVKTRFVKNIFRANLVNKSFATLGYNAIFVLSDGSVPLSLAAKNILHFQVPFVLDKINLKTKIKLKRYNFVVCNSYFTKQFIDKSFGVNSRVIYPPVDTASITPGSKENIILSVGRFSPQQLHPKKQEVLIEVFKEIYKKYKSWRLVLAGQVKKEDEKYLRTLRKMTQGVAIKILPNLPIVRLHQLYSKAAFYWHATGFGEDESKNPERMEHFGISTVEAQAGGAVPLVVGYGGQKEIVSDDKNGRLYFTKADLYEATRELIEDEGKRQALSLAAVKNSKKFATKVFLQQYEKILF